VQGYQIFKRLSTTEVYAGVVIQDSAVYRSGTFEKPATLSSKSSRHSTQSPIAFRHPHHQFFYLREAPSAQAGMEAVDKVCGAAYRISRDVGELRLGEIKIFLATFQYRFGT
jgi:hypothetical protein